MEYIVTSDSFTKISETSGTLQNLDKENEIEMSESPVFDSGLRVKTGEKLNFSNTDIYLRCVKDGGTAIVRVVPFSVDAKGGDVSSVDTTALKSVALVGNALNFYTSSDTAQAAAYSINIPAEQFLDQAATTFVPNFYFSAILYPDAINPNLNGKPVFVLGVKTKSNDGLSNTVKYSFIDVSKLVDTYVASDTSVTVSDYKFKVNISPDAGNALKLKANGLYADGVTDTATASSLGLTKLYGTTGANTDGTLTQSAITAELAAKLDSDAKAVSATTADKLSTARSLKVSLSSTSAPTFDGSANVTIGVGGILPTTYGGTGNASGTVSGAAQLNTSRNFITNLNSTSAGSFNGTASVSAGVTGTLPVANGGTGQTNLDNVTVGKAIKDSSGNVITDTYATKTALSTGLNSKLDSDATAAAAFKDSSGNVITDTYVTKTEFTRGTAKCWRFGYRISKTEADPDLRVEYLYDAAGMRPAHMDFENETFDYGDWQSVWFVRDNKPCMLDNSGNVSCYLNPNDYSFKEDGSISNIADLNFGNTPLNVMSQFPLVWVKRYEDDNYYYETISTDQFDEDYKAYAHTDYLGVVKPYFYWGTYLSTWQDGYDTMRSFSGKLAAKSTNAPSFATALTYSANNGSGFSLASWSQYQLIRTLMILISKSTDSQAAFGKGYLTPTGGTLKYNHTTGQTNSYGQFFGSSDISLQVKAFHIEDIWGGLMYGLGGVFSYNGTIFIKMTPPYNTDSVDGYTNSGITFPSNSVAFISKVQCNDLGMIPSELLGSTSTYFCDRYAFENISGLFPGYIGAARNTRHYDEATYLIPGIFCIGGGYNVTQKPTCHFASRISYV